MRADACFTSEGIHNVHVQDCNVVLVGGSVGAAAYEPCLFPGFTFYRVPHPTHCCFTAWCSYFCSLCWCRFGRHAWRTSPGTGRYIPFSSVRANHACHLFLLAFPRQEVNSSAPRHQSTLARSCFLLWRHGSYRCLAMTALTHRSRGTLRRQAGFAPLS